MKKRLLDWILCPSLRRTSAARHFPAGEGRHPLGGLVAGLLLLLRPPRRRPAAARSRRRRTATPASARRSWRGLSPAPAARSTPSSTAFRACSATPARSTRSSSPATAWPACPRRLRAGRAPGGRPPQLQELRPAVDGLPGGGPHLVQGGRRPAQAGVPLQPRHHRRGAAGRDPPRRRLRQRRADPGRWPSTGRRSWRWTSAAASSTPGGACSRRDSPSRTGSTTCRATSWSSRCCRRASTWCTPRACSTIRRAPTAPSASISTAVKPGGKLYVQLYRLRPRWIHTINVSLRAVTTRLPMGLLYGLCYAATPVHAALSRLMHFLRREPAPPPGHRPRAAVQMFDNYSPPFQYRHTVPEIMELFASEGYKELTRRDTRQRGPPHARRAGAEAAGKQAAGRGRGGGRRDGAGTADSADGAAAGVGHLRIDARA